MTLGIRIARGFLQLFLFFVSSTLMASDGPVPIKFKGKQLQELIENNKVKRLEALLPLMPKKMLMNPLLVYDSKALNVHLVSPDSPRVILFNEDASLILAYTRNPGEKSVQAGLDHLEIIEFDEAKMKFEMKSLIFDGKRNPFSRKIVTNPGLCLDCHGANPRPLFTSYNSWPGFYGSFGNKGYAVRGSKEFQGLEKFLGRQTSQNNEARYQALDLGGYTADDIGYKSTSRGLGELADKVQFSTNLVFGSKIENLMWKRLGRKLVQDKNFRKVAPIFYALGEETNRCGPIRDRIRGHAGILKAKTDGERKGQALLDKINQQTSSDQKVVESRMLDLNSVDGFLNPVVDARGVSNMLYSNLMMLGTAPDIDQGAFFDQLLLMETVFRNLGYSENDLTTTQDQPTYGIFHLKRLGRRQIDEQFFQNLISGIYDSSPAFKWKFDSLPCEDVAKLSHRAVERLILPAANERGILYR